MAVVIGVLSSKNPAERRNTIARDHQVEQAQHQRRRGGLGLAGQDQGAGAVGVDRAGLGGAALRQVFEQAFKQGGAAAARARGARWRGRGRSTIPSGRCRSRC